jgi:hypothetical protein
MGTLWACTVKLYSSRLHIQQRTPAEARQNHGKQRSCLTSGIYRCESGDVYVLMHVFNSHRLSIVIEAYEVSHGHAKTMEWERALRILSIRSLRTGSWTTVPLFCVDFSRRYEAFSLARMYRIDGETNWVAITRLSTPSNTPRPLCTITGMLPEITHDVRAA